MVAIVYKNIIDDDGFQATINKRLLVAFMTAEQASEWIEKNQPNCAEKLHSCGVPLYDVKKDIPDEQA